MSSIILRALNLGHQLLSRPSSANFDSKLPVVLIVNKFSQFIEDKNRGNRDSIVITISFVINTVQINEGQKTRMNSEVKAEKVLSTVIF